MSRTPDTACAFRRPGSLCLLIVFCGLLLAVWSCEWAAAGPLLEGRSLGEHLAGLQEPLQRFRVDELFREAGIVIAFPQRDVHLDTARPLDVRFVGDKAPA